MSAIDLDNIYYEVNKKSRLGAPVKLNYAATAYKLKKASVKKVYRMKNTKELRKYAAPAWGSKTRKNPFKRRTDVEYVNGYLKEYFQLNNVRYQSGKRTETHFYLITMLQI